MSISSLISKVNKGAKEATKAWTKKMNSMLLPPQAL